jgi:hypothetical protein
MGSKFTRAEIQCPVFAFEQDLVGIELAGRHSHRFIGLCEADHRSEPAFALRPEDMFEASLSQGIVCYALCFSGHPGDGDLKPANIKVTPQGVVKVLDFGLAAISQTSRGDASNPANSPTLTISPTMAGMILGTAAYMSPEQARGKPVDKRADIWAFGVVLYEMLTGEGLFKGGDLTETLASVVKEQPDLSQAPPEVRRLLRKCLEKDPRKRLHDIGDAWELLEAP